MYPKFLFSSAHPCVVFQSGVLAATVREVQGLVRDLLRREAQGQCGSCGRGEDRVTLEQEVHRALEAVDKLNIELNDVKDKLKAKVSATLN